MSRAAWQINNYVFADPALAGLMDPDDYYPLQEPSATDRGIPYVIYTVETDPYPEMHYMYTDTIRYYIYGYGSVSTV